MSPTWDLVIGVLLAVVGLTVIPWVTAIASDWLEQRRGERRHIRELYEEWVQANLRWNSDRSYPRDDTQLNRANELAAAIHAHIGPRDDVVRRATPFALSHAPRKGENDVLRWWALGYRSHARRKARKLLIEFERSRE